MAPKKNFPATCAVSLGASAAGTEELPGWGTD